MECDISERSARGYCPGEEGHQDEIDFAESLTVETVEPPPELPHTGTDLEVSVFGSLSLLVGVVLVRYAKG